MLYIIFVFGFDIRREGNTYGVQVTRGKLHEAWATGEITANFEDTKIMPTSSDEAACSRR